MTDEIGSHEWGGYAIGYNQSKDTWEARDPANTKNEEADFTAETLSKLKDKINSKAERDAKEPFKRIKVMTTPRFKGYGEEKYICGEITSKAERSRYSSADSFWFIEEKTKERRKISGDELYLDTPENQALVKEIVATGIQIEKLREGKRLLENKLTKYGQRDEHVKQS